jgi:hypothetical protein
VNDLPGEIIAGSGLLEGPLASRRDEIVALAAALNHPFDRVVLRWCLENWLALTQPRSDVPIVYYEHLFRDSKRELPALAKHLLLPLSRSVAAQVEQPSRSEFGRESDHSRRLETRINGWALDVAPERMKAGMKILETFALDNIYRDSPLPISSVRSSSARANPRSE